VFQRILLLRRLGHEAKELAARFFFETLVRIHRAGEGAPYTGLTEGEPEPIIAVTDAAPKVRVSRLAAPLEYEHGVARRPAERGDVLLKLLAFSVVAEERRE
jgi:Family of unknown function (DUF6448)